MSMESSEMVNTEIVNYRPTCDIKALKARAKMYAQIRQFFAEREVLEVETPILSQAGVTDVHLASVQAQGRFTKFAKSSVMMNMDVNTTVNSPCWSGIVQI